MSPSSPSSSPSSSTLTTMVNTKIIVSFLYSFCVAIVFGFLIFVGMRVFETEEFQNIVESIKMYWLNRTIFVGLLSTSTICMLHWLGVLLRRCQSGKSHRQTIAKSLLKEWKSRNVTVSAVLQAIKEFRIQKSKQIVHSSTSLSYGRKLVNFFVASGTEEEKRKILIVSTTLEFLYVVVTSVENNLREDVERNPDELFDKSVMVAVIAVVAYMLFNIATLGSYLVLLYKEEDLLLVRTVKFLQKYTENDISRFLEDVYDAQQEKDEKEVNEEKAEKKSPEVEELLGLV